MMFLSPEVALYLYKSTIQPCMEYCYYIWDGVPSYYLIMLGLQVGLLVQQFLAPLNPEVIVEM